VNHDLVFFTCVNILLGWSVYVVLLSGSLSFAQGAFMALGCYAAGLFTTKLGMPLIPALALGGLITAGIAAVLGFPALRVKGVYLILVTLGITICVRIALENIEVLGGVGGFGGMAGASVTAKMKIWM
jgi:branched-chain amino acid transport system permease protein